MMINLADKFGALGNWQKIDERFDETIVKQTNDASCVAAVGAMLAGFYGLDVSQKEILENIGEWANAAYLAEFLNSKEIENSVEWIGGFFPDDPRYIDGIIEKTYIWGAMLRDGETVGHAVLIAGQDKNDLVIIKNPFDQTTYKMDVLELFRVLSEFVLRRRKK